MGDLLTVVDREDMVITSEKEEVESG